MEYILKKEQSISKPLVFLCGPFYEEKKHDRRKILKDFFANDFSKSVIPIIVDNFLSKEKINDNTIKIPLMEEICAAVSAKTYIFLDTFSAVAELGIFSSAAHVNNICVILPNHSDKLINNLNFFVKEVYQSSTYIDSLSYRPRITRVPIASDFVTEYYEFPYDELPDNIKNNIESDPTLSSSNFELLINNNGDVPKKFYEINYLESNDTCTVNLNLKTLFYLVSSIYLFEEEKDSQSILNVVIKILKKTFLCYKNIDLTKNIKINMGIQFSEEEIIKHIIKFIELFNEFGQTTGEHIIAKDTAFVKEETAYSYLELTQEDIETVNLYIKDSNNFIEEYKMKRNKKIRKIVKYTKSKEGENLRKLHQKVGRKILENYDFTDVSFAYRKGYNILDCVSMHKESCSFFVMDINKFFNSISYGLLYRILKTKTKNMFVINKEFQRLVKSLMYNNQIPLGYTTSPLLSDIYLHDFDCNVLKRIKDLDSSIIYTRYADDIFFSSHSKINEDTKKIIEEIILKELKVINLQLNKEKIRAQDLENIGDHIKILGLNIVKQQNENRITVGKKYINETAKMYLEYLSGVSSKVIVGEDKFYLEKIISGRVAYIKQIEGTIGFNLLKNRVSLSTQNRVVINSDLILFESNKPLHFRKKFKIENKTKI